MARYLCEDVKTAELEMLRLARFSEGAAVSWSNAAVDAKPRGEKNASGSRPPASWAYRSQAKMALHITHLTPVPAQPVHTRYRRIVTPLPAPQSIAEIERLRRFEPQSMAGMPPILWDGAENFLVRDPCGNQWIDLSSGIVVANVGHANPDVMAAIGRQLDSKRIFSYAFSTQIRRELLERLVKIAPEGLDKAILFSSGTEANECALSLMRKHGLQIAPDKLGILSFESSYHGRTLAAKLAGGPPGIVDGFQRESLFHWQLPPARRARFAWIRRGSGRARHPAGIGGGDHPRVDPRLDDHTASGALHPPDG